jgi:hypothetical protein
MIGEDGPSQDNAEPDPDSPISETRDRSRFKIWPLLIALMVIMVLLAILVPLGRHLQQLAEQLACQDNLKQIALGLRNYHDTFKVFPSAICYAGDGTPLHSWRVAISPYLEQWPFFSRYDYREPWNGPNNRQLGDDIPDTWTDKSGKPFQAVLCPSWYRCPGAPKAQNRWITNYVMLIDDRPGKPNGPPNLPGSVPPSYDQQSAVLIIEIADSDIHWMEPRDVLLSELSMKINDRSKRSLSSYHGGACLAHADGTVQVLDDSTTEVHLREMLSE